MLTDKQCHNAKCPERKKEISLSDGNGLYMRVPRTGNKRWFLSLRIGGRPTRIALGVYPFVSLKEARAKVADAKAKKAHGGNPLQERRRQRQQQQGETFADVAREWFGMKVPGWSTHHAKRQQAILDNDLLPAVGSRPMSQLEPPDMLAALRRIEKRGALEAAHRALSLAHQVCAYAVATSRARHNICTDLKGALKPRGSKHHFGAITKPAELACLLRAIRQHSGMHRAMTTQAVLELAPLLFQRPGNLREMRWEELDLASATWTIPSAKMKREKEGKEHGEPHIVPLARQAVAILERMRPFTDAPLYGGWVFPGVANRKKPISENTPRKALLDMGVPSSVQTVHGFRATARTMIDEQLHCDWRHIEAQLAHSVRDALGRAYNRTEFIQQRREMMQQWADYLDTLADGDAEGDDALLEKWKGQQAAEIAEAKAAKVGRSTQR
ncbi:MAG: integrase arm-type DNA-binding domain-containing protein [Ottowia sp.]|nr:integrase arm-type DNA-binding domain-containing protein [Ottowia sp.]